MIRSRFSISIPKGQNKNYSEIYFSPSIDMMSQGEESSPWNLVVFVVSTWLLKTMYSIFLEGHWKVKLVWTWQWPPWWWVSIMPRAPIQRATGGENSYLAVNPALYSNDWPGKICPLMPQWYRRYGVTNSFLIGFKGHFSGGTICLILQM